MLVRAGTWHNITNVGQDPMQLYTIYAPAHHKPGTTHGTADAAGADVENRPAAWSMQLADSKTEKHD